MTDVRRISAGSVTLGGGAPLALIAGPCVIESDAHAMMIAESLAKIAGRIGVPFRRVQNEENEIELLIMVTPELVQGMEQCEVPPGGPGLGTQSPGDSYHVRTTVPWADRNLLDADSLILQLPLPLLLGEGAEHKDVVLGRFDHA